MAQNITVKAPGVVKLLGEHAAVYGKLSIAAAVSLYASASARTVKNNRLTIKLTDLKESTKLSSRVLSRLYQSYTLKESPTSYMQTTPGISKDILPYATIAARLQEEFKVSVTGKTIRISSKIPKRSGLASSASCYAAFTVALIKAAGADLQDDKIVDVARDGERVAHLNMGAGSIDVNTSFFGGYVSYSSEQGARREAFEASPMLLLINTGPKRPTSETVGHVATLYKEKKDETEEVLNRIQQCSLSGIAALRDGDLKRLGSIMLEDQELLKQLGVSSQELDKAVGVAVRNGALGAKLSGGGGGGMAIALVRGGQRTMKAALEKEGFAVFKARVSKEGAAHYLRLTATA